MPYEIPDFRKQGGPPERVTVVRRDEADAVFGTEGQADRTDFLRGLKALGLLHTSGRRLCQRVRVGETPKGYPHRELCYVLRCAESEIPRRKKRPDRQAVYRW